MPNDEFNATGTLEDGQFKPYGEKANKGESENLHDKTTDELAQQSKASSKNAAKG